MSQLKKCIAIAILVMPIGAFAQVKNRTAVLKENTVNVYNNEKQKENLKKIPKTVFSDQTENYTYEAPYSSKVKSKIEIGKALYVINEEKNYYEVVVADPKLLGKPKGLLAFIKSKDFHFSESKEIKYLGWIKKSNIIEHNNAQQSQKDLKSVKYLVACNKLETLYKSENTFFKDEVALKSDPNLVKISKSKIKLNDFVYVYKINALSKSAFVSNFENLTPKDTLNQKIGWISTDFITPLENNVVVKLNANDTICLPSNGTLIVGNDLYKNTFFINENYSGSNFNFEKESKIILPIKVWNHENNKITNLNGDDISMNTIAEIEKGNKIINFYYLFDNDVSNKVHLKKFLASIQNLKISISKEQFDKYKFTYSFIAKDRKSYFLIKSDSFSKWFDLIKKSIKNREEIGSENILSLNNGTTINPFLSDETNFENNFFIIAGSNNSVNSLLPDDTKKLSKNGAKVLFVVLENKNSSETQDFILQNKAYLNVQA